MRYKHRYLEKQVERDLKQKMVFLGGPRQVGKTTLAKKLLKASTGGYLNWDTAKDREAILRGEFPSGRLWVFDEIHKHKPWRNYLKGLFDAHHEEHRFLVTGSARLDLYRRGGDSLQGRYHYLRLHPFSVAELGIHTAGDFLNLLKLGGFPEPFLMSSEVEAKRWSREYRTRLIQDDVVSLEQVQDLGNLELLMLRLPGLVGSPLSINALREDLQVSHKAVSKWLAILERIYAIFRLSPFGAPMLRAVKKEQKHYHYDWTLVKDDGCRFENVVAAHLLKWIHFEQDAKARDLHLRYFRDVDRREVDFVVVENDEPIIAAECKWSDADVSRGLAYFKERFPKCRAWQISATGNKDYVSKKGIRVAPAVQFLKDLI